MKALCAFYGPLAWFGKVRLAELDPFGGSRMMSLSVSFDSTDGTSI